MSRKGIRITLLVAIFVSLSGVVYKVADHFWQMKVREFKKNPLKLLDYAPETVLRLNNFHRTKVEGDHKVWEVFGEEARYLKVKKEVVVKKPRIIFYANKGKTIEATGDEGRLFFNDQDQGMEKMILRGSVNVNYQGFHLSSEEAIYVKSKNQVLLPGRVKVEREGLELEGVGMEISMLEEKIRLHRKVRTKIQPELLTKKKVISNANKRKL